METTRDLFDNEREAYKEEVKVLRKQRKAALRQCGHLSDKLHTTRLVIESLRIKVRELESKGDR